MRKKSTSTGDAPVVETPQANAETAKQVAKKPARSRKKAEVQPVADNSEKIDVAPIDEVVAQPQAAAEAPAIQEQPVRKPIPPMPRNLVIRDIVDLWNSRIPMLNDQQVQQLTLEEARERHMYFEAILAQVLDYDIVLSDTNIWLELLVGHTSSHSDPRVNARLMFERQMEFISKLMKKKGGRFMIMSETYEEIDRFACQQEPTNYQQADFTDEALCRNVAARLAKRLIMSMQRENRLRIEGICSESHHSAFADPAIIRRVVDLFANGKKILLLTNDASVAIRSMGMCDDLQRINKIDDQTWDRVYAPIRPMACTMDDLKQLDSYTRQYHFLQQAAGAAWMQDLSVQNPREDVPVLKINEELFRPGDKHERRSDRQAQEKAEQQRKQDQQLQEQRKQAQADIQKAQQEMQRLKAEQQKLEQQRQQAAVEERRRQEQRQRQQQQEQQRQRQQEEAVAEQQPKAETEAPIEQPKPTVVAEQSVELPANEAPVAVQIEVAAAEAEVQTEGAQPAAPAVELPAFSAEDMELIAAPRKKTHRGGRRRGGNKQKEN